MYFWFIRKLKYIYFKRETIIPINVKRQTDQNIHLIEILFHLVILKQEIPF